MYVSQSATTVPRNTSLLGLLLAAAFCYCGPQQVAMAQSTTLAQLVNTGGSIDIDGFRFDGFGVGNQTGITADEVVVTPVVDGASIGLSFASSTGGFSVNGTNGFAYIGM